MSNGWKDQDWAELLACMRRRKVIPVIGEELLQVEIDGETVSLYTWMAKRLASELGVPASELGVPASEPGAPASEPGAPAKEPGAPASEPGTPASEPGTPASEPG